MNAAAVALKDKDDEPGRERRCIVTGEILPDGARVRFVADPDGHIVPDIAGTLPGRGMWVKADRATLERAIARNQFSRAAKAPVVAAKDLPDRVEAQLVRRMIGDLGIARKSGALVLGFDNVARALAAPLPPAVLVEASDGAADGRRKLKNAAFAQGVKAGFVDCLTRAELGLALGRENVIHAALKPGRLAERLLFEAARLEGFRRVAQREVGARRGVGLAGSTPAPEKGQE
ncbi:MAG: RNA-binding protein [Rhizomicrobium sp.]